MTNKMIGIGMAKANNSVKASESIKIEKVWNRAKRHSKQIEWRAKNCGLLHEEYCHRRAFKFFAEAARLTEETGIRHEVDHIIPMALGGWHHHLNLHVLPHSINAAKGYDPFWEMGTFKCWKHVPRHLWPKKLKSSYSVLIGTHVLRRKNKLDNQELV